MPTRRSHLINLISMILPVEVFRSEIQYKINYPMKKSRIRLSSWIGMAGLIIGFLLGCRTVPETGRRQLNFMSSGQEMQLGLTSFEKMKKETPINKDPALNAQVQRVGRRIAAVAPLPDAQWEFVVFDSKEVNAFCLPGGKVGIYTGILPITKDDLGLATVIGHEVAHAVARHGGERISEATLLQTGGQVLGAGLSTTDPPPSRALNLGPQRRSTQQSHAA